MTNPTFDTCLDIACKLCLYEDENFTMADQYAVLKVAREMAPNERASLNVNVALPFQHASTDELNTYINYIALKLHQMFNGTSV